MCQPGEDTQEQPKIAPKNAQGAHNIKAMCWVMKYQQQKVERATKARHGTEHAGCKGGKAYCTGHSLILMLIKELSKHAMEHSQA